MLKIISHSFQETLTLGKQLATALKAGDIICFYGDLGSGKTTMIKGIAAGLKITSDYIHSPTFTILNIYPHGRLPLFHFDMYRIDDPKELFNIGYEEFLYGDGISVIEWSEKLGSLLPGERLELHLKHGGGDKRVIGVKAVGEHYKKIVSILEKRGAGRK